MPKVDDSIASVAGSRVFSPLDANSGFWQISLAEDSKESTTFITLFGRYCLNQLAFGTSSAPEIFSWMMAKLLRGIVSVIVHMYDKLIHGADIDSQRREGGTRHGVGMWQARPVLTRNWVCARDRSQAFGKTDEHEESAPDPGQSTTDETTPHEIWSGGKVCAREPKPLSRCTLQDALSRIRIEDPTVQDSQFEEEVEEASRPRLAASNPLVVDVREAQKRDPFC